VIWIYIFFYAVLGVKNHLETRSVRLMIASEYESIQPHMQLAESTDNKMAIDFLENIDSPV
jgi:hypothetical protein